MNNTSNFSCPSMQCCEVGKRQQCCETPDPAGSGGCKQLGELCDVIYATQPNRCGQTADGKIICDCDDKGVLPINPSCCKKAGGERGREGKCIFNNMLQCAHALNCDIDPDPSSAVQPLQCAKGEQIGDCKVDCKECQGQPQGTRCIIPGSGGQTGGCYQTEWPGGKCGNKGMLECLPAGSNCKMTGFYDDCTFDGRCLKNKHCTDHNPFFNSECDIPFSTEDEKNSCCKLYNGDQAKWNPNNASCVYPCKKYCAFMDDKGKRKSFLNCEG